MTCEKNVCCGKCTTDYTDFTVRMAKQFAIMGEALRNGDNAAASVLACQIEVGCQHIVTWCDEHD
jgi:hypothetical protein